MKQFLKRLAFFCVLWSCVIPASIAPAQTRTFVDTSLVQTLNNKQVGIVDGTIGSPSLRFTGTIDSGLYRDTVGNRLGISEGLLLHGGQLVLTELDTVLTPTVTPQGTTGATTYSYKIVATQGGGWTAASVAGTTTTGNATLDGTNFNRITWTGISGATGYHVYRTVGGATQGKISTITIGTTVTLDDTGLAGDSATAPTGNTTGAILGDLKFGDGTQDTVSYVVQLYDGSVSWQAEIRHYDVGIKYFNNYPDNDKNNYYYYAPHANNNLIFMVNDDVADGGNGLVFIDSGDGHFELIGVNNFGIAGFGTSPSIESGASHMDNAFTIVVGTGGVATTGTITFDKAWYNKTPGCIAQSDTDLITFKTAETSTTVVITGSAAFTAGSRIKVICW